MDSKGNILVIDDENGIRQGCRRALEPQGFQVETAENLQEGLRRIQEGSFDLILLDVMLPDGRGVDLLDAIRERDPESVTIIITGFATVELAVDTIKRGAYNFIAKPFTADMLLLAVGQGLEKRRLSQEAARIQDLERKASELARARDEAERLDKFKSSFLLLVTHELRSPLAGAQSLVRTLLAGLAGELAPKQAELLSRVEQRLDSLLALINDLLNLAASKSIEPAAPMAAVPFPPLILRVVESFAEEAGGKKVGIHHQLPEGDLLVRGSEKGLESILRNLIGNAIKYTPEGGQVSLKVEGRSGQVILTVSDTGMGIPEEDLPHIWEEFFRAKNAHLANLPGTGLGLSIVRQYVEHFGGQITVQSRIGEGTTFTVSLIPA